jgi:hypothetical protein
VFALLPLTITATSFPPHFLPCPLPTVELLEHHGSTRRDGVVDGTESHGRRQGHVVSEAPTAVVACASTEATHVVVVFIALVTGAAPAPAP